MISGINHITFAVTDIEHSVYFYQRLLGLRLVKKWDCGAYFLAGDTWVALNTDPSAKMRPHPDYSHVAFGVSEEDYPILVDRLKRAGVTEFQENSSEGESFYFLDPDGHKLEIHFHTLKDRLAWMNSQKE